MPENATASHRVPARPGRGQSDRVPRPVSIRDAVTDALWVPKTMGGGTRSGTRSRWMARLGRMGDTGGFHG
jgi:hypothetical protein